jgi:Zn-dependent protease with chaperone function
MNFFEAQERARRRTSRLLLLFALAVAGTIAAVYAGTVLAWRTSDPAALAAGWWQPRILIWATLGTITIVGAAALYKWNEYSAGGRVVAESLGGRSVDPRTTDLQERRLLNVVEEMAIASGIPMPAVYVLEAEPGINAFAAGLTPQDAVVAVTRGTLEKLKRDELQGVIGHEFSHILNGDMRLNLRLAAVIFGILVLGLLGRGILWSLRNTRIRSSRDRNGNGIILAVVAVGIALLIVGYVGYFFGRLIQAAVSRQREFLADASAVQFTRDPSGLSGALKKIGGYALGSNILSSQGAAVGHFFFAQAFRSGFTGLWATHPPLAERIRAIDPRFDGEMFAPPEVVNVAEESFVTAGLAPARAVPPALPAGLTPASAARAVTSIGTLTAEQIHNAQLLLATVPPALLDAARNSTEAAVLIYAILLDVDPGVRARQLALVDAKAGLAARQTLEMLAPALRDLRPEHKLPLLQLALPRLQEIPAGALDAFLDTLDELVHADAQVSTFEFALQKLLARALSQSGSAGQAIVQYHSFNALVEEISVVLSALAHAATGDAAAAADAFRTGAAQLKLIETQLQFRDSTAAGFAALEAALDKLARASFPIRQRTLVAAAAVVGADGQLLITEAELLRAISAALDCPMPPLGAVGPAGG